MKRGKHLGNRVLSELQRSEQYGSGLQCVAGIGRAIKRGKRL